MSRWLNAIAPDSVRTWYESFAGPDDPALFVGDGDLSPIVDLVVHHPDNAHVRLFSSHETLRRDRVLGARLAEIGLGVSVQSARAVGVGTDRVACRGVLGDHDVPQPEWGVGPAAARQAGFPVLVKSRDSTQSRGIRWADGVGTLHEQDYWERYIDGIEFSVVFYRDAAGTAVLPVVYKGRTRRDLLPPWQRTRLCPPPAEYAAVTDALVSRSRVIAEAIDAWGFAEVEFVVTDEGRDFVLEVNPRICGTMRIAAMAADAPLFDHHRFPGTWADWPATGYACEAPYGGTPFVARDLIATSRVTCRATDPDKAKAILTGYVGDVTWPADWR